MKFFKGKEKETVPSPKTKDTPKKKKPVNIKKIQESLILKGMNIEVNGKLDERTIASIRIFQKFNGLTASGKLDAKTIKAIQGK